MRIAISGTHGIGKSTLLTDFVRAHPEYRYEIEPYHQLQEQGEMTLAIEADLDSLIEQLDFSTHLLNQCHQPSNVIFDRCPIDFIAYAMCLDSHADGDSLNSKFCERFGDVKSALNNLDLIVFLPLTKKHLVAYTDDNPAYRQLADQCFKRIYRDGIYDLFPTYNHPRVVEIWGDRSVRVEKINSYI
jgi:hypothetical protein